MPAARAKRWCFTLNNYTPQEVELYSNLVTASDDVEYIGFGREVGEQGTPHLQGLVVLARRLRLSQVRDLLPRSHLEVMRGSFQQARDYAAKEGDFVSFGEAPAGGQGQRTDLTALKNDLDARKRTSEIANLHFATFLKYQRGILAYKNAIAVKRNWAPAVVVYWGRTGAGKTRAVYDNLADPEDIYVHSGGQWFDGYEGQPIVLFDDFGGSEFKLTYLLKLLDRYPMQVPVKGGFVSWTPHEIYLTSNRGPLLWFPNAHDEHVAAMERRFTNVVFFE